MVDSKYGDDLPWDEKRTPGAFDEFPEKPLFYLTQKAENGESNINPMNEMSLSKFNPEIESMLPNNNLANSNHNFFSHSSSHFNENPNNNSNLYLSNNISLLNHGFNLNNQINNNLHNQHLHHLGQNNNINNNLTHQTTNMSNNLNTLSNFNPFLSNFRNLKEPVLKNFFSSSIYQGGYVDFPPLVC